jgi:hypothetical protein
MATDQERMSYYLLPAKNPGSGSIYNPGATGTANIYVPPAQKPPAPRTPAEASRNSRARREGGQ